MKRKLIAGAALFALTLSMNMTMILAATPIKVTFDGTALTYNEAQPEMYNDRAMVPIRETANFFGMTTSWDEGTRTMTFTKGGRTIIHTLDQNTISVNGAVKTFDTPSFSKDGRTMMPVRMLAEALGSQVDWDGTSYTVVIKNNNLPTIISASPNKTNVTIGETVTVTAIVSGDATSIRLTDGSGRVLGESNEYTQSGDNKSFTASYIPTSATSGLQSVTVSAGNNGAFNTGSVRGFNLTVSQKVEIINISSESGTVEKDALTRVLVTAGKSATIAKITNDHDSDTWTLDTYTDSSDGRLFDFQIRPTQTGTTTYTVHVGAGNGYSDNTKTFTLYAEEMTYFEIKNIDVTSSSVRIDDSTKVTITAGQGVESIKIVDYDDNTVVSKTSSYSTSGNDRIWEISITVRKSGSQTYRVYAYDSNNKSIDKTFTIKGSGSSSDYNDSDSAYINRIELSESTVYNGDSTRVEIYANSATARVYIEDDNGNQVASRSSYSYEADGYYVWAIDFTPDRSQTYRVYAENSNGNTTSSSFSITVN